VRVRVRFIPSSVAEYFNSKPMEVLELPDGSKYSDLVEFLRKRYEGTRAGPSRSTSQESLFEAFAMLCDGMPITRKLDELIDPGKDVLVIAMAFGG